MIPYAIILYHEVRALVYYYGNYLIEINSISVSPKMAFARLLLIRDEDRPPVQERTKKWRRLQQRGRH